MWFVHETQDISSPQIINDSKTPSGQVHVGSLRGVVLHDVINRTLRERGIESVFLYGIDDMDPLDGVPENASEQLKANLGKPLCAVAAPEGSTYPNLAEHYAADFIDTFAQLGVDLSLYRTSEHYRSGKFNEAIERILINQQQVRDVYLKVSKSQRPENWYPFQVVCENCGNIGSTDVYNFDGKEVQYRCVPNYTSWANGCAHSGSVSPFDGNGKLVWKLEWVAKWHTLGVTFEGAGKDHCTKGGSRDVANACFRRIFGNQPPRNMPYEFFLISGSKMSSSKGIGASAASMTKLLPPAVLRFLMMNTLPKRTVNFATDQKFLVKLFNEYDKVCTLGDEQHQQLARMIGVAQPPVEQPVSFQLLIALLQLPHIDVLAEIRARYVLTKEQLQDVERRITTVKTWLDRFAAADDKIVVQQQRPTALDNLPAHQCALLQLVAEKMTNLNLVTDETMQQVLFDCARLVPCAPREAFAAIYRAFLDSENGPRAGSLLAYLNRDMVLARLTSCKVDEYELAEITGLQTTALQQEITREDAVTKKMTTVDLQQTRKAEYSAAAGTDKGKVRQLSLVVTLTLQNGQTIVRRSVPMPADDAETFLKQR